MGKLKHLGMSLLLATTFFSCGDDYDDTALRNDVNDLKSRVEKLESWCSTTNTQISALQGLVSALEQNDYVTGVTPIVEGSVEVGYTITFTKSKPITIYHGKDGKNGADGINGVDGITPLIGAEKDTDGIYYWTIKLGDADSAWLMLITIKYLLPVKMEKMETMVNLETMVSLVRMVSPVILPLSV